MNPTQPPHLRLLRDDDPSESDPVDAIPGLRKLMASFAESTGWTLAFREDPESYRSRVSCEGAEAPPPRGRLAIDDMCDRWPAGKPTSPRVRCEELLDGINLMLAQWNLTRDALWRREAELAAGVPVVVRADDRDHLARRLESSLRAAVDGVGATAAALYVLDDATSQLKMRACWGLSPDKLLAPPRPLQGALADLEALLGHAIVLEDVGAMRHWESPEPAASSLCVPVSSATTPLGTLWVFDAHRRDFSTAESNLVEIVAGRIAAELEREAAVAIGSEKASFDREVEQVSRWQRTRLKQVPPVLENFDVAGWTRSAGPVGGSFHHWSTAEDGRLVLAMGDVQAPMLESAFGATTLATLVRSHAEYQASPGTLLGRVGEALWADTAGDLYASLAFATLEPEHRKLSLAGTGDLRALLLGAESWESLLDELRPLGGEPVSFYPQLVRNLRNGDLLLMYSDGVRSRWAERGRARDERELVATMRREATGSAQQWLERLVRWLAVEAAPPPRYDMSLLVLRAR